MLSVKETQSLIEILASGSTLETAAAAFQRAFVRSEHFRIAAALAVLIEDGLLPQHQRTVALFIIHDLYKSELPGIHPFYPFLVGLLGSSSVELLELHERNLLCQLLTPASSQAPAKKTAAELEAAWPTGGETLPLPNLVRLARPSLARCAFKGGPLGCLCISGVRQLVWPSLAPSLHTRRAAGGSPFPLPSPSSGPRACAPCTPLREKE